MAFTAAAVIAAAGAGMYAANQAGKSASQQGQMQADIYGRNSETQAYRDAADLLMALRNSRMAEQDQAFARKQYADTLAQRELVNRRAVASQTTPQGQTTYYDPATNTWRSSLSGLAASNAEREATLQGNNYTNTLYGATVGNARDIARRNDAERLRTGDMATATSLLERYRSGGRPESSVRDALIGSKVAHAVDPLMDLRRTAQLQSLRQGGGMDQVFAALNRQTPASTRAAIADANLEAPTMYAGESQARNQNLLQPYATLAARATSEPGGSFVPFTGGDNSASLLAAISRNGPDNPASTTQYYRSQSLPGVGNRQPQSMTSIPQVDPGARIQAYSQNAQNIIGALRQYYKGSNENRGQESGPWNVV